MRRRLPNRLLLISLVVGCGPAAPPPRPPPEVLVVEVVARDVPQIAEWLGTTEGSVDAEIHAQVPGYLVTQDYQEGARVHQGDLLFRIDSRPMQAALEQARSDLAGAQAALERSRLDVERYRPLVADGAVSRQEFDNAVQRERGDQAAVRSAQAAVESAEINLGFTEIRAPIDGIVGVAQRQVGDFVGPGDPGPLTKISNVDPIRVAFPLSEQEYLRFAQAFRTATEERSFRTGALELILADGSVYPHAGTGYPAGREIDPHTGTITVKGVFPNPDQLLRPGQYARIRVRTGLLQGALVVPERAIRDLQGLGQVAVVGADDNVEVRTVETGPPWGTLRVITKGVSAGERVIVEGLQKVESGTPVVARRAPPELAGAPPASGPAPGSPAALPTPETGQSTPSRANAAPASSSPPGR